MNLIPAEYRDRPWLTLKQVAFCLGVTYETFRRYRKAGRIEGLDYHPLNGMVKTESVARLMRDWIEQGRAERHTGRAA